jgi:hypothetical protein
MHNLSKAEQAKRKDITQAGVAQAALDKLEELEAEGLSSSEVFTEHGYGITGVVIPAQAEVERIKAELKSKPSKDVASTILDVVAVKTKHGIAEYVPPEPEPEPEVIE